MDEVTKIVLYQNEDFTDPVVVHTCDMSNITYSTGRREPTSEEIDGVTFTCQELDSLVNSLPEEFSEPLVQYLPDTGSGEVNPDWHNKRFYIKPNMIISVSLYVDSNNRLVSDVRFIVVDSHGVEHELTTVGRLDIQTPLPSRAIRFGYFKQRTDSTPTPSGELSLGVFIVISENETQHSGSLMTRWISPNFWDGSFQPIPITPAHSKNVTPSGFTGGRADYSMPHEPGNAYASLGLVRATGNGLHIYRIPGEQYSALCGELWADDLVDMLAQKIKNRIFKPTSGLLALHKLPVQSTDVTAVNGINICGTRYLKYLTAEAVNVNGQVMSFPPGDETWKVDLRDTEEWSMSFLDCDPYVSAMIVLPFIGTVNIDINKFVYGIIGVRYVIDVINGNCIAEIFSEDLDGHKLLMGRHCGNCAYTYPITSNDGGGFPVLGAIKTAATVGLAVGASIQTAGASAAVTEAQAGVTAAAAEAAAKNETRKLALEGLASAQQGSAIATDSAAKMGAAKDALNGAVMSAKSLTSPHNLSMAGTLPNNASALAGDLRVWLYLTYKNDLTFLDAAHNDMLGELCGHNAAFWCKAGALRGSKFFAGVFHADKIPEATDSEKSEIEMLISQGVYWNGVQS